MGRGAATSSTAKGYSRHAARPAEAIDRDVDSSQGSSMNLPPGRLPARLPDGATFRVAPKSLLALILSIACALSLGVDVPSVSAAARPDKSKKNKQDPMLKGLPITELSADE